MLRGWRRLEGDSVKCSGVKSAKGEELQGRVSECLGKNRLPCDHGFGR